MLYALIRCLSVTKAATHMSSRSLLCTSNSTAQTCNSWRLDIQTDFYQLFCDMVLKNKGPTKPQTWQDPSVQSVTRRWLHILLSRPILNPTNSNTLQSPRNIYNGLIASCINVHDSLDLSKSYSPPKRIHNVPVITATSSNTSSACELFGFIECNTEHTHISTVKD